MWTTKLHQTLQWHGGEWIMATFLPRVNYSLFLALSVSFSLSLCLPPSRCAVSVSVRLQSVSLALSVCLPVPAASSTTCSARARYGPGGAARTSDNGANTERAAHAPGGICPVSLFLSRCLSVLLHCVDTVLTAGRAPCAERKPDTSSAASASAGL